MSAAAWFQLIVLVALLLGTTRLLGPYLARVFAGDSAPGDRVFLPVERVVYRVAGIDPEREQRWNVYAVSLLAFSAVSVLGLYALQRLQGVLPLNPTDVSAVPPALGFNTAASFVTNTNWQNYGGESTMSRRWPGSGCRTLPRPPSRSPSWWR
jgi:K+-transporting ATPase ATPase A chain